MDSYLSRAVDAMFCVGTAKARKLLAEMREGRFYCEETGRLIRDPAAGALVAKRLIEMGRERAAI